MLFGTFTLLFVFFFRQIFSETDCGRVKSANSPFPWNVGIYVENENGLELVCFGTIIKSNAVLTAAHCFSENIGGDIRKNSFYLGIGPLEKQTAKNGRIKLQKIDKRDISTQRGYNGLINFLIENVAVVKTENFQFSDNVKPVCVDWSDSTKNNNETSKQSAWSGAEVITVDRFHLDHDDCLYQSPKTYKPFITDDKSCISVKDISLKHEDEGAGLVFLNPGNNRFYLEGIISTHESNKGKFSTYTKFSRYLNWISNICAKI